MAETRWSTIAHNGSPNRSLIEAEKIAHLQGKNERESQTSGTKKKIDHATGSRNGKYLESLVGIGFQSNLGMRFHPQHESSGYTTSDNQQVSQC